MTAGGPTAHGHGASAEPPAAAGLPGGPRPFRKLLRPHRLRLLRRDRPGEVRLDQRTLQGIVELLRYISSYHSHCASKSHIY